MKKTVKSTLSVLLALCMLLGMLPTAALAAGEVTYTQVTSIDDITAGGDFVLVAKVTADEKDTYYALGTSISSKITKQEVTVSGSTVSGADSHVWSIESNEGKLTLSNGTQSLGYAGSSTNFSGSASGDNALWTVEAKNDSTFRFVNVGAGTRAIALDTTANFGAYATSNETKAQYVFDLLVFKAGGEPEEETKVKTPTADPKSGTVEPGTTVTLKCTTDGAKIQYKQTAPTQDGDWTQGSTITLPMDDGEYSYEVKATKDGLDDSDVLELTYTVKTRTVVPISDALAGSSGEEFMVKGVVTFVDGRNVYLQDETGGICAYLTAADSSIQRGDTLTAFGKYKVFNQLPELDGATVSKVTDDTIELTATDKTIDGLTNADICTYVKISGVKVSAVGSNVTITDDDNHTIDIYSPKATPATLSVGDTVTVTAAVGAYNKLQLRTMVEGDIVITEEADEPEPPTPPTPSGSVWTKVTEDKEDWSGTYLVVYEASATEGVIFNSSLDSTLIDKSGNKVDTAITDGTITADDTYAVTIEKSGDDGYLMKTASGLYAYSVSGDANKLDVSDNEATAKGYPLSISMADGDTGNVDIVGLGGAHLRYNKATNNGQWFRFFKSSTYGSQQPIALYEQGSGSATLKSGTYVIWAPAYNKAMSSKDAGYTRGSTDVTLTDGVLSGYADEDIWTVTKQADDTYTISYDGKELGMDGGSYTSLYLGGSNAVNVNWKLTATGLAEYPNTYYVENTGRSGMEIEWYAKNSQFTGYGGRSGEDALYALRFTPVKAPDVKPDEPVEPAYQPENGDRVVIYNAKNEQVMTGTSNNNRLRGADAKVEGGRLFTDGTEVFLNVKLENGVYTFTTDDGKVLNTAATISGSGTLTLVDPADAVASNWELLQANGGWYIKNTTAKGSSGGDVYIEYYSGFTTYYSGTTDIYIMQFFKDTDVRHAYETDADVVDDIAQWGGGGPYDEVTHAASIPGDLFATGDMLDANAVFSIRANGVENAKPYQRTTGSGSTPENPNYSYYMGGENIGAKEGDYMQFALSTKGYGDMTMSFRIRVTGAGAKEYALQYSADGGSTWGNFENGEYNYSYHNYGSDEDVSRGDKITDGKAFGYVYGSSNTAVYVSFTFDVPAGAENVDNLLIRLVPGTERVSGAAGAIGGNVRIDSVSIVGSPIINDDSVVGYVSVDPDGREEDVPGGTGLTMTSATSGAAIMYRFVKTDGSDLGSASWSTYSGGAVLPDQLPVALEVYAVKGAERSMTRRFVYNAGTVEAVKMTPNGGGVYLGTSGKAEIVLSCATEGAVIWYRTDKMTSDKDGDGKVDFVEYTAPIALTTGFGSLTVDAYATYPGLADSAVTTRTFTERQRDTYQLFFGQMHGHTSYSDGAGTAEQAYEYVSALDQKKWNMDFLSITDHSNSFDDAGGSKSINDAPTGSEWNEGKALAKQYTTGDFVGIFGYEMTWSNGLGHINTFNTTGYQDRTQSSYTTYSTALQNYYAMLKTAPSSISQFNHPGTTFGDFSDFAHYDEEIDQLITLIEVGNGEGAIGSSGYFPSYEYYTRALDKGWHVAPTNNQDNHKGGWGTANTGRDVVLVDELTEDAIYEAMRNYRVYATEDLNLEIYYTFDSSIMGTILDANSYGPGEKATIKLGLNDPDGESATVEVIVNGGLSIAKVEKVSLKENTIEIEVPTTYNYYYIKVTQADGDIAVTAPVWIGSVEAVGVSGFAAKNALTVAGQEQTFNLELYNNEKKNFEVTSIEFTLKDSGEKIGASTDISVVKKMGTASTTLRYTFPKNGIYTIRATIKGTLDGVAKTYTQDLEVTVMPSEVVTRIIVDGTHYNDYVTGYYGGRMGNMTTIAANNGVEVTIVGPGNTITSEMLSNCALLVISAPAKKDGSDNAGAYVKSVFEDSFMQTVADYVQGGGTVIVAGLADYQDDKSSSTTPYQSSVQLNALLAKIGSTMAINDDEAYDDDNNGGQAYRLYPETFNMSSEWTRGIITKDDVAQGETYQTYSQYSGCTVDPGDGTWLVKGFDTTYSIDSDKDGKGGVEKGKAYFLAYEQVGLGNVFAAGGVFVSDFEVAAELDNIWDLPYANRTIYENILHNICAPETVTPIADTRKAPLNQVFVIEGYVTSGTTNPNTTFFDAIYVQDETGGTTCFPYAVEGLAIGAKVRILGYTDAYQGDREIQIITLTVLDDKNLNVIAPTVLTTKNAADYDTYGGMLVKTSGTVSNIVVASGRVSQFDLTDSSGVKATIFIDGYIWGEDGSDPISDKLANGQTVTAVGLLYLHPEGDSEVSVPVLRVRNCDEIVITAEAPEPSDDDDDDDDDDDVIASVVVSKEAAASGDVVTAGVKVTATRSSDKAPSIDVTVQGGGSAKVEIPVTNIGPGVVAVAVDKDGKETILRDCIVTENGVVINAQGNVTVKIVDNSQSFTDTSGVPWAKDAITFVSARELLRGTGGTNFDPNMTTSRGMVATILYRLEYEPASAFSGFADVVSGSWYADAVAWAADSGVVTGYADGTFGPNDSITREQLAVMLYRYAGLRGLDLTAEADLGSFTDGTAVSDWAGEAVTWAVGAGLINGTTDGVSTQISPAKTASRAETAVILQRFLSLVK